MTEFEYSFPCSAADSQIAQNWIPPHRSINLDPFFRILLIVPTSSSLPDIDVVRRVAICPGYVSHKFVRQGDRLVYLYVKYETVGKAFNAKAKLRYYQGFTLSVEVFAVYLRAMFDLQTEELKIPFMFMAAYVDCALRDIEDVPLQETLSLCLADFGNPMVIFCKSIRLSDKRVDHAYVTFSSPAEAFGACVYFGQWQKAVFLENGISCVNIEEDSFRILLHRCPQFKAFLDSSTDDFYELDYFFKDGDWDIDLTLGSLDQQKQPLTCLAACQSSDLEQEQIQMNPETHIQTADLEQVQILMSLQPLEQSAHLEQGKIYDLKDLCENEVPNYKSNIPVRTTVQRHQQYKGHHGSGNGNDHRCSNPFKTKNSLNQSECLNQGLVYLKEDLYRNSHGYKNVPKWKYRNYEHRNQTTLENANFKKSRVYRNRNV